MATVIISAVLAVIVFFAARYVFKSKGASKCSGCSSCSTGSVSDEWGCGSCDGCSGH